MKAHITEDFYTFFKKLAANNHKEWFDENREVYTQRIKAPFELLCGELLEEMAKSDKAYSRLLPKDVIFRINKDVRFSKDKAPYKLNRSALLSPGGRKDMSSGGFYFELGPETNMFYAGIYMPDKEQLLRIREYITNHLDAFNKVISKPEFIKTFGEIQGNKNKRLDAAFKEASAKQPLLFNTQFYIQHELDESLCMSSSLVPELMKLYQIALPLNTFINRALEE
jgi:uncharacterized protein (TIGR02453 family)